MLANDEPDPAKRRGPGSHARLRVQRLLSAPGYLRYVGDVGSPSGERSRGPRRALKQDFAGFGDVETRDAPEERGLTTTTRAGYEKDFVGLDAEGET